MGVTPGVTGFVLNKGETTMFKTAVTTWDYRVMKTDQETEAAEVDKFIKKTTPVCSPT